MALSGKELESHKAKRLVARNEMIGAAQVLTRRTMVWCVVCVKFVYVLYFRVVWCGMVWLCVH